MTFDRLAFAQEWKEKLNPEPPKKELPPPLPVPPPTMLVRGEGKNLSMTVREAIDRHYESQAFRALAKNSRRTYQTALEFMRACYGESTHIGRVVREFDRLAKFLEDQKMAKSSVQFRLNICRWFLISLTELDIRFTYRIPRAERQAKKLKHQRRWFNDEEIEKCLAYQFLPDPEYALLWRTMIRVFIETGGRFNEIAHVRWKDIDIKQGMLQITETKTEPRPVFFAPRPAA